VRILVTGASGWVGSRVARIFAQGGHQVLGLVRPNSDTWRVDNAGIDLMQGELGASADWVRIAREFAPEACVHCAWFTRPGEYLQSRRNIACIEDGLNLLDVLASVGCGRAVYLGTCAEYDTDRGYLREESPTRPETLYGAAKLALSVSAPTRAEQLGISLVWARLFYVFGPTEDWRRMVPSLILRLLAGQPYVATGGRQVRDYLHVDDVAAALVTLTVGKAVGVFNVASGTPVTVEALIGHVASILGRPELVRFGATEPRAWDPLFVCGDASKLRLRTGWVPQYDLLTGLQQTADWWRSAASIA
jgi:nucleoside-diphosphate-sugar epimerase